jgi:DNA-binding transcriptional MocR family regulator
VPVLHDRLASALEQLARQNGLNHLIHGSIAGGSTRDTENGVLFLSPRLGTDVDPDRILPTNGTQNALLVLLPHLVGKGGILLAERLSYGALQPLAGAAGVELRGIEIDENGILPDAFEAACRGGGARKALYCNPTVQNPTTAIMPLVRRLQLAEISRRYAVPIVEDDALGRLHPDAVAPIAKLAPDVVWYVMSVSKALAHGLRLAYLVAPSPASCTAVLRSVERLSFWNAAPLQISIVGQWVASGGADTISAAIRGENIERERFARSLLERFGLESKTGSMHVWLMLPDGWTGSAFADAAGSAGVLVRPAALFAVDDQALPNAVRLSLSTPENRMTVQDGVRRLAKLLEEGPGRPLARK